MNLDTHTRLVKVQLNLNQEGLLFNAEPVIHHRSEEQYFVLDLAQA